MQRYSLVNTHQKGPCGNCTYILLILHSVIRNQGYTNYRSTTQFEQEALLSSNTKVVYNNFELQEEKSI